MVEVNPDGFLLTREDGTQSLLLHHELKTVEILHHSEGVDFLLVGPQTTLVVPQSDPGGQPLLRALQALGDFDNAAFIEAMAKPGKYCCWRKA